MLLAFEKVVRFEEEEISDRKNMVGRTMEVGEILHFELERKASGMLGITDRVEAEHLTAMEDMWIC